MIDMILYVPDFSAFAEYTAAHHPEMIARGGDNSVLVPPEITGVERTPAVVSGSALMVYARVSEEQVDTWRTNPMVEVLAEAEFTGDTTALTLIEMVESDEEALGKYESVCSRDPVTAEDEFGNSRTYQPPRLFGTLMGAGGAPWPVEE